MINVVNCVMSYMGNITPLTLIRVFSYYHENNKVAPCSKKLFIVLFSKLLHYFSFLEIKIIDDFFLSDRFAKPGHKKE